MSVDLNKLDWRNDADHIKVDHTEWNFLVDSLIEEGYCEAAADYKTVRRNFPLGTFKFDDDNRDKGLFLRTWDNNLIHFYTFNDNEKNENTHVLGTDAFNEINRQFLKEYKVSFTSAFGVWPRGKEDKITKGKKNKDKLFHYTLEQCNEALPAIILCDEFQKNKHLQHIYKADVSSAYPYELTLPLPTMKGMIGPLKGCVEPPQNYVAYWVKSGHIIEGAEGGVDTRRLLSDPLYQDLHKFKPISQNEETYLLPYSNYDLSNIINDLYQNRSINPFNKGVMNSFIGMLRSRRSFQRAYMGHISALVYARHISYMCELDFILKANGCHPIMYATDSIMWEGYDCGIADTNKYLGSFTLEYADCDAAYKGCGSYVIQDPNTGALLMNKHQGIAAETWTRANIQSIDDFLAIVYETKEFYNKRTHKYELRSV